MNASKLKTEKKNNIEKANVKLDYTTKKEKIQVNIGKNSSQLNYGIHLDT